MSDSEVRGDGNCVNDASGLTGRCAVLLSKSTLRAVDRLFFLFRMLRSLERHVALIILALIADVEYSASDIFLLLL